MPEPSDLTVPAPDRGFQGAWPFALLLSVAAAVSVVSGNHLRWVDERVYVGLAERIVAGQGYVTAEGRATAYWPPGFPFAVAVAYKVWPAPISPKLLNVLALVASAWLLARVVTRVSPRGGKFVPLLFAANPLLLYTSSVLVPQTLAAAFLAGSLYCLFRERSPSTWTALAGFLYGLLILVTPTFLPLLPVVAGLLVIGIGAPFRRSVAKALILVAAATMTVLPWTLRNLREMGSVTPVSTNGGFNLLVGNSEFAGPNRVWLPLTSEYHAAASRIDAEPARDRYFQRAALAWIETHPREAMVLYLKKVANFFNFTNEFMTLSDAGVWRNALLFVGYYPLLLAAVIRVLFRRRFPVAPQELVMYGTYVASAFLSAVFFTRVRYRVPFDTLLIALVAAFGGYLIAPRARDEPSPAGRARTPPRAHRKRQGRNRVA